MKCGAYMVNSAWTWIERMPFHINFHQTCLIMRGRSWKELESRNCLNNFIGAPRCIWLTLTLRTGWWGISYSRDSGETSTFKTEQKLETKSLSRQRFSHLKKKEFPKNILINILVVVGVVQDCGGLVVGGSESRRGEMRVRRRIRDWRQLAMQFLLVIIFLLAWAGWKRDSTRHADGRKDGWTDWWMCGWGVRAICISHARYTIHK